MMTAMEDSDVGHLGLDMTCLADSCLEILNEHPNAVDGQYLIKFSIGCGICSV